MDFFATSLNWFYWKAAFTIIVCLLWIYAAWRFGLKNKQQVRADNPLAYGTVGFDTTRASFWIMNLCILGAVVTFSLVFITIDTPQPPHKITQPKTRVFIDPTVKDPKVLAAELKEKERKAYETRVRKQNQALDKTFNKAAKQSKKIIKLYPTLEAPASRPAVRK